MDIVDIIMGLGPWFWIVAGLILLALELLVPGGILVWMGLAGIVTGLASMVQPLSWPLQLGLFGVLSVVAIFAWTRYARTRPEVTDRPYLNRRAERFIGQVKVLDEPIAGGFGRVTLDDTVWRVAGPDLPAGSRIRIVGAEGAVLKVDAEEDAGSAGGTI